MLMAKNTKKRPLSAEQKAEAARLNKEWIKAQKRFRDRGEKLTQKSAAEALGWTQANLWHYLNAGQPIGTVTLMKISALCEFDPRKVRATILEEIPSPPADAGPVTTQVTRLMEVMDRADQDAILRHAEALVQRPRQ